MHFPCGILAKRQDIDIWTKDQSHRQVPKSKRSKLESNHNQNGHDWVKSESFRSIKSGSNKNQIGSKVEPKWNLIGTIWEPNGNLIGTKWKPNGNLINKNEKQDRDGMKEKKVKSISEVGRPAASASNIAAAALLKSPGPPISRRKSRKCKVRV